jgi:hypothetical protein
MKVDEDINLVVDYLTLLRLDELLVSSKYDSREQKIPANFLIS